MLRDSIGLEVIRFEIQLMWDSSDVSPQNDAKCSLNLQKRPETVSF